MTKIKAKWTRDPSDAPMTIERFSRELLKANADFLANPNMHDLPGENSDTEHAAHASKKVEK